MNQELQQFILRIVITIFASCSVIGSGFIVFSYIYFRKKIGSITALLICCLSTNDLGFAISTLLTWQTDTTNIGFGEKLCYAQALLLQFFGVASYFWMGSICYHAYQSLVVTVSTKTLYGMVKYYVLICVGVPLILAVIPIPYSAYGSSSITANTLIWCWIDESFPVLRFDLYYGPALLIWLFNILVYILIKRRLNTIFRAKVGIANKKITLYLLIFIIIPLPGLINRTQNFIYPTDNIFWLYLLEAIVAPSGGWLNAIVYGLSRKLRFEYWKLLNSKGASKIPDDGVTKALKGDFYEHLGRPKDFITTVEPEESINIIT